MENDQKLSNPKKTIEIIQKYNFNFQKKFGQNFLIDSHVLNKIIAGAGCPGMIWFWKSGRESELDPIFGRGGP